MKALLLLKEDLTWNRASTGIEIILQRVINTQTLNKQLSPYHFPPIQFLPRIYSVNGHCTGMEYQSMAILLEWGISQWPLYWNGISVNGHFTGMGYQAMAI